jgi:hypothetical protein
MAGSSTILSGKSLDRLIVGNKCADHVQAGQLVDAVAVRYQYLRRIELGLFYMEAFKL